jgi:hypothetical protein
MDIKKILNNSNDFFDVDINSIKYYNKYGKVIPVENHEVILFFSFFKEKNIDIINSDLLSIIYDNLDYFKSTLLKSINDEEIYYFISNKEKFKNNIENFKKIYLSLLNNSYVDNKNDPIILSRIKKDHENILCLVDGEMRFFISKILNIKKIKALIVDSDPENEYIFY